MNRNKIPIRSLLHRSQFLCIILINLSIIMSATPEEMNISKSCNKFGIELFKKVAKDDSNKVISPFSAHVVLTMAYQGAAGETLNNMAKVFNLPEPQVAATEYHKIVTDILKVQNVTLNIANKIYVQDKFELNPVFKKVIEKEFLSEAEGINFEQNVKASNEINSWVQKKTNKKILELIQPDMLDASTRLVLLNAVYFKGNWTKKFDVAQTSKRPFYLLNGEEIQVDMMAQTDKFKYSENEDLNCKILELPYVGNELSMLIFLPNERDGINSLQEKLSTFDMSTISSELAYFRVDVEVPKFRIESTIPLKDALVELGAGEMFTNKADFKNMAKEPLKVSDVIQKTFIEVNEEGSEAAAATGSGLLRSGGMMCLHPIYFSAEYPFVIAIIHYYEFEVNLIHLGKILQPTLKRIDLLETLKKM